MESPPGSERVSRRLREQFAPAYLAITGLVQVLVLDALITKVEGSYTDYGAVEWLVVVATFLVCVDIWHEYLMTVLSHVWLPGLLDSLVPFAFLVAELLMVHFVGQDLRGSLLGYGLVALLGLASARLAVALVGLGGAVVIIASSVPMWNEILRYAQGGPAGGDRSGPAPGMERS
ncbi:MAG: hypothetical protein ACRDLC_04750 [Actinomycetota bacterium]